MVSMDVYRVYVSNGVYIYFLATMSCPPENMTQPRPQSSLIGYLRLTVCNTSSDNG